MLLAGNEGVDTPEYGIRVGDWNVLGLIVAGMIEVEIAVLGTWIGPAVEVLLAGMVSAAGLKRPTSFCKPFKDLGIDQIAIPSIWPATVWIAASIWSGESPLVAPTWT